MGSHLGDESFELAALDPHRAADIDDGEAASGDLPLDAASGAAQLAGGLVEGKKQGDGCGRGAGVCGGLQVPPKCADPFTAIAERGGTQGEPPYFGGTQWGYATGGDPRRRAGRGEYWAGTCDGEGPLPRWRATLVNPFAQVMRRIRSARL